jgi:ATP-binding cassette subfamily C (CFTR/MRP) protein 1
MSRFVAKNLRPRQKAWSDATQKRIAATSSMLGAMKVVKMLGLQHNFTNRIQELREAELWAASKLRWIMVYYNASGMPRALNERDSYVSADVSIANALGIFSPAITLVIYAMISVARGNNLDTETAFTTMAILSMVTHPANMVMTIVPRAVSAFSGFERIQAFLLRDSLQAHRGTLPNGAMNRHPWDLASAQLTDPGTAIQIRHLSIGHKPLVLEHINMEVAAGSLAIISGPTGSGKSTLLRAMLGEVVPVQGSVSLSTRRIAYCAQKPWLPSGTIKEVIHGATETYNASDQDNARWYDEVISSCCLTHDFNALPHEDRTRIGSGGLNLSGGQRQRIVSLSGMPGID